MLLLASFGEFDALAAAVPWLGLTALAVVLGLSGIMIGGWSAARARLAMRLGCAACVLELIGITWVLTNPWWIRRFQGGAGPNPIPIFVGLSAAAIVVGLAECCLGRPRLVGRGKPGARPGPPTT